MKAHNGLFARGPGTSANRHIGEHALAIKTAIRAQNVEMGIEPKKIAK